MNDEMRGLVEHIGGSVAAMDGLFKSLLDISKLDAGVWRRKLKYSRSNNCLSGFAATMAPRLRPRV